MTITTNPESLKVRLDSATPATLADQLRAIGFGSILRRLSATLRRQNPNAQAAGVASSYDLATLQVLFLPDDAKARSIDRAYARAGGGATGEMTVAAVNATPTSGQLAVTPSGNIAFLGSDAYTDVDVTYTPADQDVVEYTFPVASNQVVLPSTLAGAAGAGTPTGPQANLPNNAASALGVNMILEAESLAGTVTGKFIVIAPGSAPGTTKEANLDATKSKVQFKASDGVTSCRVKLGVFRAIDLNALLEAQSPGY